MNTYFIILAAGKGTRFSLKLPKQFIFYKDKPVLEHSIDKALKSKLFNKILIVTNTNYNKFIKIKKNKKLIFIKGGLERQDSSLKALKYLKKYNPSKVFIHDAARPNFTIKLLKKLNKSLNKFNAVVPYINTKNSTKYYENNRIINLKRDNILLTQTPQCFDYKLIYKLSKKNNLKIDDEASLFITNNLKIKFIKSDIENKKITTSSDLNCFKSKIHYGIGFDIHKLVKNKPLYLGGIKIPFHSGLKGHSDGDVIIHSIIDSILGSIGKKDIGAYFPSNNNKFKNLRSTKMLKPIMQKLNKNNFYINNIDINLICEKPKVSKYRKKIIKSISNLLSINKNSINLKGKTVEKLGLIGKEKAIACEVITSVIKYV